MTEHVRIGLCVNAGSAGLPNGRCAAIVLHDDQDPADEALHLGAVDLEGPRCVIRPERRYVRLAGKRYPIAGYRQWAGNMAWDQVLMKPQAAAAFFNAQRANGWWSPDSGYEPWWDRWASDEPFTAEMFGGAG